MTAVDLYKPHADLAVPEPHDTDSWILIASDVIKIANVIYDTPFVPDGLRGSAPAVAAAILAGRELGIGPMTALQHIHVIKGKPAQSAALMRALVQAQGHQWQDGEVSDVRAVVRGRRKGESEWTEVAFTAAQAKTAGIDLGRYPQDKLYARATSRLARRKFADVIAGMPYAAEELEDGDGGEVGTETVTPAAAEANGHATPAAAAPRTAQRRTRAAARKPVHVDHGEQGINLPPSDTLPLLPGEEDATPPPGPDQASPGQVGIIRQHFKRLGFDDDEREQRLVLTARLAGRLDTISSTKDLSRDQALAVSDTLARCKNRERLITLLAEGEAPDA